MDYIQNKINDEEKTNREVQKYIDPNEKVFVLGLAESATAIGMATAGAIKGSHYIATSRENPIDMEYIFEFEEEHTLITTHKCYLKDKDKLINANRVIIVEDEITTGNTMINLIKKICSISNAKKYSIVSILNFSKQDFLDKINDISRELNITIEIGSILYGHLNYEGLNKPLSLIDSENILENTDNIKNMNVFRKQTYKLKTNSTIEIADNTGIFGISFEEIKKIEEKAIKISQQINCEKNQKILVIGHGENIYLPSRVGYYISNKCLFKSTTKSIIIARQEQNYPIQERSKFNINGVDYYLYNKSIIEKEYDKVYFIVDADINLKLTNNTEIIKI